MSPQLKSTLISALKGTPYNLAYATYTSGKQGHLLVALERQDEQPITLNECAKMNRTISAHLDIADMLPDAYMLEVSSPGLDRPLFELEDYKRFVKKNVKVTLHQPYNGQKRFQGHIESAQKEGIHFVLDDKTSITVSLVEIHRCKLIPIL